MPLWDLSRSNWFHRRLAPPFPITATYCPLVWKLLSKGLLTQAFHPLRSSDRTWWVDTPGSAHDGSLAHGMDMQPLPWQDGTCNEGSVGRHLLHSYSSHRTVEGIRQVFIVGSGPVANGFSCSRDRTLWIKRFSHFFGACAVGRAG